MLPALATLAFLITLFLFAGLAAEVFDEREKIVSALKGRSQLATRRHRPPVLMRVHQRVRQPWKAGSKPQWRAVALLSSASRR